MDLTHVWVIEAQDHRGWRVLAIRRTRFRARTVRRLDFDHLKTRIRKYVPA